MTEYPILFFGQVCKINLNIFFTLLFIFILDNNLVKLVEQYLDEVCVKVYYENVIQLTSGVYIDKSIER